MTNLIITEIHEDGYIDRWYYGAYSSEERANAVALDMNERSWNPAVFYVVVDKETAIAMGVKNMPF